MAAEEDKRRRNTAASARCRVKKKQREQALEKQAKDMSDKVSALESKVQQLEMENKWLKGLITDKNDGKPIESYPREKEEGERSIDEHVTGVGTCGKSSSSELSPLLSITFTNFEQARQSSTVKTAMPRKLTRTRSNLTASGRRR